MGEKPRILVIDNCPSSTETLSKLFQEQGYHTLIAHNGEDGILHAVSDLPDLILLDIDIPDLDGFEICARLKKHAQTVDIPVLFLSGLTDVEHKVKAFQCGGIDYITKPYHMEEVIVRVKAQLQLLESRRSMEQAKKMIEEWSATLEQHVTDRTREIMRNERRLHYLAMHDTLTLLPNRNAMHEALSRITESGEDSKAAVLYLDLSGFDDISRTFGQNTADELIQQAAKRLQEYVDEWHDTNVVNAALYRAGEDEFVLLLEDIDGEAMVIQSGEALLAGMQESFSVEDSLLYVPPRVGFTIFPDDGNRKEILLQNAQMAVDDAKRHVDAPYRIRRFHPGLAQAARERMDRIQALRSAVHLGDLYLEYQPKIDMQSRRIVGAEALVRWKPDGETPLPPSVFIPIAEETGIIHDLGQLVLEQICRQIAEWKALGFTIPPIAVNISPLQLNEYNFPNKFLNTLQGFGLPARQIIIEITETAFLHDRQHSTTVLQQLQNSGIAIHLDDFGTGYSSFSYLSDLPLDAVKIDKSFINRCISSEHDDREAAVGRKVNHTTILEGIITLARGLHLKCIAEGVETPEQAALLQSLQCNMAQGFYYFRPMPPRQMQTLW